jgi:allantoin racemase
MQLTVQHIFTEHIQNRTPRSALLWQALDKYFGRLADDSEQIEQKFVKRSTNQVYNRHYEHENERYIVESLQEVERSGADAAVVACIADPGVHEARSILRIPVAGAGEASVAFSQFVGRRFGIVVVRPEVVPMVERQLDRLQCYGRAIPRPVRPIRHWSYDNLIDAFEGESDLVLEEFERVSRECIADGADVIISGCAYVGPLITQRGLTEIPGTGVPVIDCTAAAIEMAISMARMHRAIPTFGPSRAEHSPYSYPESLEPVAPPSPTDPAKVSLGV